jgi:hypothetical protein
MLAESTQDVGHGNERSFGRHTWQVIKMVAEQLSASRKGRSSTELRIQI